MRLPAAPPDIVDAGGQPLFGRFAGSAQVFSHAALAPPYARSALWRRFHHKRWHYVAMAAGDLFCAVAIVDLGWTSTAFAYAFDRRARKLLASFSQDGIPGWSAKLADNAGGASRFRFLSQHIAITPDGQGGHALTLRCGRFAIDARFAGATPMLLAVGAVEGGSVHATQKSAGMALSGQLQADGRRFSLDGGVASVDYSNGLLARETAWRWASAHDLRLGFNLQAGYFGAKENALWLDGQPIALGAACFEFDSADPMAPWRIHTDDGLLDLQFRPEGMRRADKNLLLAASRYVQPIGTFSGWVKPCPNGQPVAIKSLVGVTEEHHSRW